MQKNNKAVVLVISLVFMTVLLVLTGAYFSGLLVEKRAVDTERAVLQALNLAEAGANHGVSELRKRIRKDLNDAIESTPKTVCANNLADLFNSQDPLGLLEDYGGFTVSNGQAILEIAPLNLNAGNDGTYTAKITITAQAVEQNPARPSTDEYEFYYNYAITATATTANPSVSKTVKLHKGSFVVNVHLDNFAKYALFTSQHMMPSGTTVWFTGNTNFGGPVATNTRFSFANNPSGHFTEEVTQLQSKARFHNKGSSILLDADYNSDKDVPVFDKGFKRGYPMINLPSSVSQADLKAQALGGMPESTSNGVYVPNSAGAVTGGIYVRGNQGQSFDDAVIALSKDANDNPTYTITRLANTTVVTVDYTFNQTKVQSGATTNTYQGIPDGIGNEGVILYVNDNIKSLSGTVQKDSAVTISSERDIIITNNIVYEKDPRLPGNENYDNLLGILSWGGNVRIGASAPNNVTINAVVMAPKGIFTVDNYRSGFPRGVATLFGGAITEFYGAFGTFLGSTPRTGYGRNFVYDSRMLRGIAPPYFPYIGSFTTSDNGGLDLRLIWQEGQ
jgi:hypothetical protein